MSRPEPGGAYRSIRFREAARGALKNGKEHEEIKEGEYLLAGHHFGEDCHPWVSDYPHDRSARVGQDVARPAPIDYFSLVANAVILLDP